MAQVGIVGTTSWGTTLAILLGRSGHDVTIWARTEADADLSGHEPKPMPIFSRRRGETTDFCPESISRTD